MANRQLTAATFALAVVLVAGGSAFAFRGPIRDAMGRANRGPVPPETARIEIPVLDDVAVVTNSAPATPPKPAATKPVEAKPTPSTPAATKPAETTPGPKKPVAEPVNPAPADPAPAGAPKQFNLKVPMVFQAPFKIWDDIHEDACEEAAALMLAAYVRDEGPFTPEQMDARILPIVDYENATFGDFHNTTAAQTVQMMHEHLGVKGAVVIELKSIADVKAQIALGRPVALPASGRLLKNPNFRQGGPNYHMLVAKGYTADGKIVTHDPGTRLGENYVYDEAVLWDAIHDFNGGDVLNGAKVGIVVK